MKEIREKEDVLAMLPNCQMWIQIGKTRRMAKLYFLPIAPGKLIITKTRIIFLSTYRLKKWFVDRGAEEIQVEIPICKILGYYKRGKYSESEYIKDGRYANQCMEKHAITFFCKAEGDYLGPKNFSPHHPIVTAPYEVLKSQKQLENAFKKSKLGNVVKVHIANLQNKQTRRKIGSLIQKLREKCTTFEIPMYLSIESQTEK